MDKVLKIDLAFVILTLLNCDTEHESEKIIFENGKGKGNGIPQSGFAKLSDLSLFYNFFKIKHKPVQEILAPQKSPT